MCAARGRYEPVGEGLVGLYGALRDVSCSVHPNIVTLMHAMPVDRDAICLQFVCYPNDYLQHSPEHSRMVRPIFTNIPL